LAVAPGEGARHLTVWDLQTELRAGDLLVVNDTRVLRARLAAHRASGGAVELLVLEACGEAQWLCLARPAKRLKSGEWLTVEAPDQPPLRLQVLDIDPPTGGRRILFPPECLDAASLEPLLLRYGAIPLPPYIHAHDAGDAERYQTRYAARPGAVAAPTAGLHLSDALLQALRERGVDLATVTLHVGLGTFRPVEQEDLRGLALHKEWVEVSAPLVAAVEACRARGGRVIAIGTTTVRSLEGVAALHGGRLVPHAGPVDLVIQPGFRFAVVEGLLTNFHLPRSSLLLLVSALIGRRRLLTLYGEAIARNYRFFSYGDAMWIPPEAIERLGD
jgi:S-adenosylmethionine:tRNA ribosyltransferase-isomerase